MSPAHGNTSHAVRAQRNEAHDSLDDFPTPPWATRALCEQLGDVSQMSVREPAANRGHMARPLEEYFAEVLASDVHDYGAGYQRLDYLFPGQIGMTDWTITNPPFRLAQQFIERALGLSRVGVATLVRTVFLEGVRRHRDLFDVWPPFAVYQFTERVPMHKGKLTATGSTATAYCWIVWHVGEIPETRMRWIPPCRNRLERAKDYPPEPVDDWSENLWA